MPVKVCAVAGCPEVVKMGRCAKHQTEHRKTTRSVNDAFYSCKRWRLTRRHQLFDHPLCQYVTDEQTGDDCGIVADSVHHIREIEDGGAKYDPPNLMSTCRSHHSTIHAQRRGGVGNS